MFFYVLCINSTINNIYYLLKRPHFNQIKENDGDDDACLLNIKGLYNYILNGSIKKFRIIRILKFIKKKYCESFRSWLCNTSLSQHRKGKTTSFHTT